MDLTIITVEQALHPLGQYSVRAHRGAGVATDARNHAAGRTIAPEARGDQS